MDVSDDSTGVEERARQRRQMEGGIELAMGDPGALLQALPLSKVDTAMLREFDVGHLESVPDTCGVERECQAYAHG